MSKKRGFRKTTLDCINRHLDEAQLAQVRAVKDRCHEMSFVLRFEDDNPPPAVVAQAKQVVADVMGPMSWGMVRR